MIRLIAVTTLAAATTFGGIGIADAQSDFYATPMNSGAPNMMMMTPMAAMQPPPMMQEPMADKPMMKKHMSRKMMMKKKMMMMDKQKAM